MRTQFVKSWNASNQPRKQRKYRWNAPTHLREKMMSGHLSKELRKKYTRRSFILRKGDTVKVMNGEYAKKTGKISVIDLNKLRAAIEGIQITKKDGSKVNVWFKASKLMIIELNLEDSRREASLKKENKTETKSKESKK